jgi:hypothetical protein
MKPRDLLGSRKFVVLLLVGALILTGTLWLERTSLVVVYHVHRLQGANEDERQNWAEKTAALDVAAMPRLVNCLSRADARVCGNAHTALLAMVKHWEPADCRRTQLAECLASRFATLSEQGGQIALEIEEYLLRSSRANAQPELISACRKWTLQCLGDERVANRIQAIRFALRSEMSLLDAVVPLLNDPVPEVRRAAMVAVGPESSAVSTDDLLRWLHDPDLGVRRLCESALRGRGLQNEHIHLGRLMSDSRPGVRLQVIDLLRRTNDLEPGVWLRQLSHDSVPAVRAAAVRAAREQEIRSLKDRLEQMAQNDPSPSIRQLAQYYLSAQRSGSRDQAEQ